MTLAMKRLTRSGTRVSSPACWAIGLAAAAFLAYYWQREFAPLHFRSLFGAYVIAPAAWLVVAALAIQFVKRLPQEVEGPTRADQRTGFFVAGLIGLFLVSLQLIVGMFGGFGRSPFAHTPDWLVINAFFAGAPLLGIEAARTAFLRYGARYSLSLSLVATSLILAALQFGEHQLLADTFKAKAAFWGGSFLPAAALGLLAGFFAVYLGVRGALLVSAPLTAFMYFSPILPAAEWPIRALAGVAGPALGLWLAESFFEPRENEAARGGGWFSLPSVAWVVTAVIGLVMFWFSFGFFGYLPAFVPSHSMEPVIKQGDLVVTRDISPDDVKVGDIVLYELKGGQRVLHRVVDIRSGENGQRIFIFKGDNNNAEDLFPVEDEQIRTLYIGRVPKIGWLPIKVQKALLSLK